MDPLQEGETGERLPFLVLVRQVSDSTARAEFGLKGEEEVDKRDVVERRRERGFGLGKDKVASLDDGEPDL